MDLPLEGGGDVTTLTGAHSSLGPGQYMDSAKVRRKDRPLLVMSSDWSDENNLLEVEVLYEMSNI